MYTLLSIIKPYVMFFGFYSETRILNSYLYMCAHTHSNSKWLFNIYQAEHSVNLIKV